MPILFKITLFYYTDFLLIIWCTKFHQQMRYFSFKDYFLQRIIIVLGNIKHFLCKRQFVFIAINMANNLNNLGRISLILFMANLDYFVAIALVSVLLNSFAYVRVNAYEDINYCILIF
ncbi:hypothetical protein T552_04072 [Pneumocystis carinii B80]|uniref:Uncharacterized protein n=1 Tax=Pneumocystis carinii (strain B80) TaxID=1408658 RepID=A0A0W4ZR72_PNEC8|nr:hypothetical protein T552_04072 [Pneumocystis carinii B80]KTW30865.1 hypothetical protein T552_04072 [Pneumocystis carinii B80]